MRNRRVNVYKNTNLNQVVTDYRAGTPLKNVNTQQAYKNITPNVIPGGHPSGDVKVPLAGTRISRVRAAPIGGYRKTLATNADGICCAKDKTNKNGFTQEIYKDTWTDCSGVCAGDKEGIVARPSRAKKPLIRSGMQYNAAAAPNKLRNPNEKRKKYAFSYSQYQKNLRCLSYERSQEKYKISAQGTPSTLYKKSSCCDCRNTVYKPNNKKFQVQGAVSSGSRLERLKLDTIQGSRIATRHSIDSSCDLPCIPSSKKFTLGYRSAEPRFVTNPNEGGDKTRGFVPTRWRQSYLAHGRAIGNIFQRTTSYNVGGKDTTATIPYSIGSIKAGGCCHPPNAGNN